MDMSDGRGAWEWYHSLSSEDKNIVDEAIKVGAK
jgi:hypothetical protein